jgi:Sec-independent protein translocase protein TatA
MRISIGQIIVLLLLLFLLFGDFQTAKKKLIVLIKQVGDLFQEKNRKKGT